MNIVDCLAIAPYYLDLFFAPPPQLDPEAVSDDDTKNESSEDDEDLFSDMGRIMQVLRIARMMRIFKLARRSVGLQSMAHTVRTSWKVKIQIHGVIDHFFMCLQDLGLLFSLVIMGMLFYGSLEYFIENGEEDTGFYSIPQGMWWAVQTLTSLGYGDFSPTTLLGKLVGSACAVSGVLVMALPIPIVVDNFGKYYAEQKKLEQRENKVEAMEKAAKLERKQYIVTKEGVVDTLVKKSVGTREINVSSSSLEVKTLKYFQLIEDVVDRKNPKQSTHSLQHFQQFQLEEFIRMEPRRTKYKT